MGSLSKKVFRFSGKFSNTQAELGSLVKKNGGSTVQDVSSNVDFLVYGEQTYPYLDRGHSESYWRAQDLISSGHHIQIIDEKKFNHMVSDGLPPVGEHKSWLLTLNLDDHRSQARSTYEDDPAVKYEWSDRSHTMGEPAKGDFIVIRDEKFTVLGMSYVGKVETSGPFIEEADQCPNCGKIGNVRPRKKKKPKFRCVPTSGCDYEFDVPDVREIPDIYHYTTDHQLGWTELSIASTSSELAKFSTTGQSSIRPLDRKKFSAFLKSKGVRHKLKVTDLAGKVIEGGHRVTLTKTRIGQASFRKQLLKSYGEVCAVSGPAPKQALHACHLYSFAKVAKHHDHGGLLLRSDIHKLFDDGLINIDPKTERISVNQLLKGYGEYFRFDNKELHLTRNLTKEQKKWLKERWLHFN